MSLQKLGRYELVRVVGKGAMGLVYEGLDPNLNRRVAIKTIKVENLSEEAAAEYEVRFRVEAQSAARLQHPNIVSVYDSARDGDIAYMVMEFIQGDDLKHHLDQGTLYTLEQTLGIMRDLLSALDYAHAQNVVHRDIKPANLLIEKSGRVKLTDFGVARIQDSGDATRTQGTMVGTLKYMSPEQVQGRPVDARADIFAAGIVLYQLLTGKRPFDGSSDFAIIQQIVGHAPAAPSFFNSKLPPAIDLVVGRALAKVRDQRYSSAKEFLAGLEAASREAADPTIVPPASPRVPGAQGTWTSTHRAGESLLNFQPGLQSNAAVGQSTVTQEIELVYWKDIKDSHDVEDLQGFMSKFPAGIYADLARRRLRQLGVLLEDESGTGVSTNVGTVVLPRSATAYDATMRLARGEVLPGMAPVVSRSTEDQAALVGDAEASTVFQPNQASQPASEPLASSSTTATVTASVSNVSGSGASGRSLSDDETLPPVAFARKTKDSELIAETAASATAAADSAVALEAVGAVEAVGALAAAPKPIAAAGVVTASAPRSALADVAPSRRSPLLWVMAGVLLLAGAGFGISRLTSSGPSGGPGSVAASGVVAAPASTQPVMLTAPALPSASAALPAAVAPAASAPIAPQVFSLGVDPPTTKTAAELKASADVKAAKKAERDKEKLARQALAASAAPAAPAEPVEDPSLAKRAAPSPAPSPTPAVAANTSPRQACEDRMLIGFQMCMTDQCAKRAFANHPICVDRRAMEERRREAEQTRR